MLKLIILYIKYGGGGGWWMKLWANKLFPRSSSLAKGAGQKPLAREDVLGLSDNECCENECSYIY